jgi:hypothetical protein
MTTNEVKLAAPRDIIGAAQLPNLLAICLVILIRVSYLREVFERGSRRAR